MENIGPCLGWVFKQSDFNKSILLEYREIILGIRSGIKEVFKYGAVFYWWNGPIGYLGCNKKTGPYFGFIRGIELEKEFTFLTGKELKQIRHFQMKSEELAYEQFNSVLERIVSENEAQPRNWHNGLLNY